MRSKAICCHRQAFAVAAGYVVRFAITDVPVRIYHWRARYRTPSDLLSISQPTTKKPQASHRQFLQLLSAVGQIIALDLYGRMEGLSEVEMPADALAAERYLFLEQIAERLFAIGQHPEISSEEGEKTYYGVRSIILNPNRWLQILEIAEYLCYNRCVPKPVFGTLVGWEDPNDRVPPPLWL